MRRQVAFLTAVLALPASAGAIDKVEKNARPGDIASEYVLTQNGDLFRQIGRRRCQITTRVSEFKVAAHPADGGAIYFVKDRDLKVLVPPSTRGNSCPKADVRDVAPGVKKYALLSAAASPFALMTLDADDTFQAVGPEGTLEVPEAVDFAMNACFGQDGKAFSNYSAFVIDRYGLVTKIKGSEAGDKTDFKRAYASLDEFRSVNKVCD